MNREIKFRAWDIKHKQLVGVEKIDFLEGQINFLEDHCYIETLNLNEIVLMQFTGFKDKYYVEIYEGDIIKMKDGNIFEIYWDEIDGNWTRKNIYKVKHPFNKSILIYYDSEIIGNIYQNQELMEATNG